jgi:hypothetical protein
MLGQACRVGIVTKGNNQLRTVKQNLVSPPGNALHAPKSPLLLHSVSLRSTVKRLHLRDHIALPAAATPKVIEYLQIWTARNSQHDAADAAVCTNGS